MTQHTPIPPLPIDKAPDILLLPLGYQPPEADNYCAGCEQAGSTRAADGKLWTVDYLEGNFRALFEDDPAWTRDVLISTAHGVCVWKGYCPRCAERERAERGKARAQQMLAEREARMSTAKSREGGR